MLFTNVKLKNCTDSAIGLMVESQEPIKTSKVRFASFTNSKNELVP